jgi:hypothetical protein
MYCIDCGTLLPDEAKFCYHCGLNIGDTVSQLQNEQRKQLPPPRQKTVTQYRTPPVPNDILLSDLQTKAEADDYENPSSVVTVKDDPKVQKSVSEKPKPVSILDDPSFAGNIPKKQPRKTPAQETEGKYRLADDRFGQTEEDTEKIGANSKDMSVKPNVKPTERLSHQPARCPHRDEVVEEPPEEVYSADEDREEDDGYGSYGEEDDEDYDPRDRRRDAQKNSHRNSRDQPSRRRPAKPYENDDEDDFGDDVYERQPRKRARGHGVGKLPVLIGAAVVIVAICIYVLVH